MENKKRILITGIGVVSIIGDTLKKYWQNLLDGVSGITKITAFDAKDLPCKIAGQIHDFDPVALFGSKEARRMPRCGQMALAAAIDAVADARLPETMSDPERVGVCIGTALGGVDAIDMSIQTLRSKGYRKVSPFTAVGGIPNLPAFLVGKQFQALGPNSTIATACATGTQAIGEGAEFIRRGAADMVIVGGTDAFIQDFGIGAFCAMRALPTNFNDAPQQASRPFDAQREGFVLSEGAAVLILESEEHARARGADVYAEVAGHASSTDGYHMASPDPEAGGPVRAMRWALQDAGLEPTDVDYINAHGTSTPLNDSTETTAIKKLFGEHAYDLAISSTKSMIGHAMGASGALETIACALSIRDNKIAPTINYENPDPACDLDYTPNQARERDVNVTLSNSFGLGGQNACLVLKKYAPA
jgi:beta-ketoacyl-acyl-carrier-protein synthase II